jgi:2-dehydro-3-deoxyphosphogluconate aldolase/(4S)-4-hydroxy-2-oxoglutarate aldolase
MTPRTSRSAVLHRIVSRGAVAVLRLDSAANLLNVCRALQTGGVDIVELTMTTPGALSAVGILKAALGDSLLVGMGSLLNIDDATQAIEAGSEFLVSPVFSADVVSLARANEVAVMPGAYSPTEILAAHAAGADFVKVFPADSLGPAFLRAVLGPMPFLRLMPTGGVTPENVGVWLRSGAVAVGLGSALVDPRLVAAADFRAIEQRARLVADAVQAFQRDRRREGIAPSPPAK